MSNFANTVDSIGDEELTKSIIDRSITEILDNYAMRISHYAFYGCSALTIAKFSAAKSIGTWAFANCSSLTTVNFPVVTSINSVAFYVCRKLTIIDFPAVMDIGFQAFTGCSLLTTLILRSETKATLRSTNAFTNTPIASGTGYIYVPSSLIDSYKTASNWSTYAAQFRALEDYTIDGTTTGALDESKI